MPGAPFLDTNVLIYAFSNDAKRDRAWHVMRSGFAISVQALNEFTHVSRRKFRQDWHWVEDALFDILSMADEVHGITLKTHLAGLKIAERHKLSTYDGLHLSSALSAGANIFLSEDMHHGLRINDQLTVLNPFA